MTPQHTTCFKSGAACPFQLHIEHTPHDFRNTFSLAAGIPALFQSGLRSTITAHIFISSERVSILSSRRLSSFYNHTISSHLCINNEDSTAFAYLLYNTSTLLGFELFFFLQFYGGFYLGIGGSDIREWGRQQDTHSIFFYKSHLIGSDHISGSRNQEGEVPRKFTLDNNLLVFFTLRMRSLNTSSHTYETKVQSLILSPQPRVDDCCWMWCLLS